MVSKRFFYNILFRLALIALTFLLFFFLLFRFPYISYLVIAACAAITEIYLLLRYINTINRKLDLFLIHQLSGEVTTAYRKPGVADEFKGLYHYFELINSRLERTRTESEVRNNYFKTIVNHTAIGLISFTSDGKVELFNDAAKKMFGIHVLRDLSKLDLLREGLSDLLLNMEIHDQQLISLVVHDELVQLTIRKGSFKTGDKMLYLVSFQNIVHELEQQEIESWQKLIRVLTHEIMNSITPIISIVATLGRLFRGKNKGEVIRQEEINRGVIEKTVKGLDIIEGRGHGLIHFVQNYRDVTLLPKPVFELIHVRDMFLHMKDFYDDQLQSRNITLKVDCNPSLKIRVDVKLMQQVLINLIKNAIEALEGRERPEICLSAQAAQERMVMEVSDNGWGMPPDAVEQIFVPFFTTKEAGSGIGLSLSRQIVRLHGGSLNVTCIQGEKTTFTIRI